MGFAFFVVSVWVLSFQFFPSSWFVVWVSSLFSLDFFLLVCFSSSCSLGFFDFV